MKSAKTLTALAAILAAASACAATTYTNYWTHANNSGLVNADNWGVQTSGRYPAHNCKNTLQLCFHTDSIANKFKESWDGRLVNINGSDNPVKNTNSRASFWGGTEQMPWLLRGQNSWNLGTNGGIFVGNTENGVLAPKSAEALTETHLYLTGGTGHWARNVKVGGYENTSTGHFTITDAWYGDNLKYDTTSATKLYLDNILYVEHGSLTVESIEKSVQLEVNKELEIACHAQNTRGRLDVRGKGDALASVAANTLRIGFGEGATGEAVIEKGGLLTIEDVATVGGGTATEDPVGSASLLVKDARAVFSGELRIGDTVRRNASAKFVNSVVTNCNATIIGNFPAAEDSQTAYEASLEIDGGTTVFTNDVRIGRSRGAAGDKSKFIIKNGATVEFTGSANTLIVGWNGSADLQIDNSTLSMINATIAVFYTQGSATPDRTASVRLGEGAKLETRGISHGGSNGKGEVIIDGGTLKAAKNEKLDKDYVNLIAKFNPNNKETLADGSFDVKIGAKGAAIDTAGFDVKIGENVASGVESGEDGGVAFTGGGSVEFSYTDDTDGANAVQPASAGWTGGTKVAFGTELKFATLASARALLAGGVEVVAPAEAADQATVLSLPADSTEPFERADLANVKIVYAEGAKSGTVRTALSADAKSIVVKSTGAVLMLK